MLSRKLMNGTSDTKFSPDLPISRIMFVAVLYRMAGSPGTIPSDSTNVPLGTWYARAAKWALENHILLGYSPSVFGPDDPITREQLVAFLYRYAKINGDTTLTTSPPPDLGSVSSWARPAVNWALAKGILNGAADGSIHPSATASRAEVAAILSRYLAHA